MAKMTDVPEVQSYSSGVKKVLILGSDGKNMASIANPLPVDAVVTVDTMNLTAEMKVDTGHDLYIAENVIRVADLEVSFDAIIGLNLIKIQSVENKTQGYIYNTENAVVTNTNIELSAAAQTTGYPVISVADEMEIVYRGESRLTNGTQTTMINSDIIKKTTTQDLSVGFLDYTTDFVETIKLNSIMIKFTIPITQTITLTLDNNSGTSYDTIIREDELLTPASNYFWQPDSEMILEKEDKINIVCTNAGTPASVCNVTILGEMK